MGQIASSSCISNNSVLVRHQVHGDRIIHDHGEFIQADCTLDTTTPCVEHEISSKEFETPQSTTHGLSLGTFRKAALDNQCNVVKELLEVGERPDIDTVVRVLKEPKCRGEMRELCLTSGIDLNQVDSTGKALLDHLIYAGTNDSDLDALDILLENGARVDTLPDLMYLCLGHSDPAIVLKLLQYGAKFSFFYTNISPLCLAVFAAEQGKPYNHGHYMNIIQTLLENGADVNQRCFEFVGSTVVFNVRSTELISVFVDYGGDLNFVNDVGRTILSSSIKAQRPVDFISHLIDKGADINALDQFGKTVLMWATDSFKSSNSVEVIRLLIARGVDPTVVNHHGTSALFMCIHSHLCSPRMLKTKKLIIEILPLLMHDSLRIRVGLYGLKTTKTPLLVALECGNVTLARILYEGMMLTPFDLNVLPNHPAIKESLRKDNQLKSIEFLEEISSSPPSLFVLSLVKVSTSVGYEPGRKKRVDHLPVYDLVKSYLNFTGPNKLTYLLDKYVT